jgi:hypothetical protein
VLVLVSFVLVLAAAVTLVVGLLQSGLTLIYLSIACSVLAGVVLAVAVLRGRPEPRPAAAGRAYTPPPRPQVPAGVGASSPTETTTSWSSGGSGAPPPPPPPPPAPVPEAAAGEDLATRAAGSALLGRLRGRRAEQEAHDEATVVAEPAPVGAAPVPVDTSDRTTEIPVGPGSREADDGFPIADYDRLRATELLSLLPPLDRNQLEAVRERESSGKNRFTIMSRVDSLLAAKAEPAWEAADDSWDEAGTDAESEAALIERQALREDEDFAAAAEGTGEVEDDELDELVSPVPAADFPIAGYETLTVGQILPRLTELSADELGQVRAREQQGRNRGTILDRIDRLSARAATGTGSGALAMPPAAPRAGKAPARRSAAAKAVPVPVPPAPTPAPARATTRKASSRKAAPAPAAPAPAPRKAGGRKAAAVVTPELPAVADVVKKGAKAPATKAPAAKAPAAKAPAAKGPVTKAPAAKAVATKAPAKKAAKRGR